MLNQLPTPSFLHDRLDAVEAFLRSAGELDTLLFPLFVCLAAVVDLEDTGSEHNEAAWRNRAWSALEFATKNK